MRLVDFVLFGHIAVVIAMFAISSILLTAQRSAGRAPTRRDALTWAQVGHRLEPAFPVLAVLLLGLGAWLVALSGGRFRWSDGWVLTAVAALVVMELNGALVLAPRGRRLGGLLRLTENGPLDPAVRRTICDPAGWAAAHLNTGLASGVGLTMAVKPSAVGSALFVGAAGALAATIGAWDAVRTRAGTDDHARSATASPTALTPIEDS